MTARYCRRMTARHCCTAAIRATANTGWVRKVRKAPLHVTYPKVLSHLLRECKKCGLDRPRRDVGAKGQRMADPRAWLPASPGPVDAYLTKVQHAPEYRLIHVHA